MGNEKKNPDIFAIWNDAFPGRGWMVSGLLWPFYFWRKRKRPTNKTQDVLEQIARDAIFWEEIGGLRTISEDKIHSARISLRSEFSSTVREAILPLISGELDDASLRRLGGVLERSLWESLSVKFVSSLGKDFDEAYGRAFADSLRASLYYVAATLIVGNEARDKSGILLKLWLLGLYPLGIDKRDNFLVVLRAP